MHWKADRWTEADLGCYTHRLAISNHRLVSFVDGKVTFRSRDSAHKNKKRLMAVALDEFLRRFLHHDEDGDASIDYLRIAMGEVEDPDVVLEPHDKVITKRLSEYAYSKAIRPKYEWLRAYHDRTVAQMKPCPGRKWP